MKVVAFNGSARKGGNTSMLLKHVLGELEKEGVETNLVEMAGQQIRGCTACYKCIGNKDKKCVIKNDQANSYIQMMVEADGIILGSPTYFSNVTTEMKALIDRAGFVNRANGDMLKRKVGASVVAVRRAGGMEAFNSMNHFFLIGQMIVVGSSYWNIGIGLKPGDVEQDEEGIKTMETLGQNMAWLLKQINE
jgi:multimeric flavodoxin WrbA